MCEANTKLLMLLCLLARSGFDSAFLLWLFCCTLSPPDWLAGGRVCLFSCLFSLSPCWLTSSLWGVADTQWHRAAAEARAVGATAQGQHPDGGVFDMVR
jgi:hypothetical protein